MTQKRLPLLVIMRGLRWRWWWWVWDMVVASVLEIEMFLELAMVIAMMMAEVQFQRQWTKTELTKMDPQLAHLLDPDLLHI